MSDLFLNLYEKESIKCMQFAKIIGSYQGLLNVVIDYLTEDNPFYTKEMLLEKLNLNLQRLKNDFKNANE